MASALLPRCSPALELVGFEFRETATRRRLSTDLVKFLIQNNLTQAIA